MLASLKSRHDCVLICCVHTNTLFDTLRVKAAGKCPVEGLINGHDEAQIDIHARHFLQHSLRHSLGFSGCTTVEGEGCARRLSAVSQAELQEHESLHHHV